MDAFLYVAAFTIGAYIIASQEPPQFRPSRPSYDEERPITKPPLRKRASSADLKKDTDFPVSSPTASSGSAQHEDAIVKIPVGKKKKKACDCVML